MPIETPMIERRGATRDQEDVNWEAKVLARVSGRLQERDAVGTADEPVLGWEATVLDTLRKRIERESK